MVQIGIKQRRERERQELRRSILEAAREIAAREGWHAVTIRKVAERIEYSPPMIYQYFASKDDLLLALLREGFADVTARLRAAHASATTPEEGLLRVAEAYWAFAWERPELYQVMHGLGGVPFGTADTPPEARAAFAALRDAVRPLTGDAAAGLDDDVDLLWGALHGLVALAMAGRVAGGQRRATRLMGRAVRDLAQAWRTSEDE
jgi:AcrR family transcriptional regulator